MSFPQELKELRTTKGYTQADLASLCGVATGTIQQYELGKRTPTARNLDKIAHVLGVKYGFFANGNPYLLDVDALERELEPELKQMQLDENSRLYPQFVSKNPLFFSLLNSLDISITLTDDYSIIASHDGCDTEIELDDLKTLCSRIHDLIISYASSNWMFEFEDDDEDDDDEL